MNGCAASLDNLIRDSKHALVIGVGGGDVAGALATARLLEFCGLRFTLGGLSWERNVYALTFFIATGKFYDTLARPARAVRRSSSLDQAAQFNAALHALGIATELDSERKFYQAALTK